MFIAIDQVSLNLNSVLFKQTAEMLGERTVLVGVNAADTLLQSYV